MAEAVTLPAPLDPVMGNPYSMDFITQAASQKKAATPSLMDQASTAYPALAPYLSSMAYRTAPKKGDNVLEFYPPGEEESFDKTRPAIEVYDPKTKPSDIAGDVVSHYLARGTDKTLTNYYDTFKNSLTPEQKANLRKQYEWSVKNEGEERPYEKWEEVSGLPAYFRGYAFGQWTEPEKWYTPDQMQMFDGMMNYLRGTGNSK